jgi:hypothetical protein
MDILIFLVLLLVIGMVFIDHRLKKLTKINQAVLNELKRASCSSQPEPLPPPLRLTTADMDG